MMLVATGVEEYSVSIEDSVSIEEVIQEQSDLHLRLEFVHSDKQGNEICPDIED